MTVPEIASEIWLRQVFDSRARDDVFGDYRPSPGTPSLVLVGGQPAAGKTSVVEAMSAADLRLVPVVGDDLRE
ncbi:MAG: zeta toxin family protein [Propionibacteriaceae bacterium]|nr:zeta toxin family protein [Propionibacteriaceae bacterium]